MPKQKTTIEQLKTDFAMFCNRKKIKEKKNNPLLFQYNTVLEYPRFLDFSSPLLVTGMHGSGPFYYSYQLALQALGKGHVVVDDVGLFEPLLEQGREYANLRFIQEGFLDEIRESKSIVSTKNKKDEYQPIVIFNVEKETSIQFLLKQCTNLESLENMLTQSNIPVIRFNKITRSSDPDLKPSDVKKVFVTHDFCDSFTKFKNRIHMRDTHENMQAYGIERRIHLDLHSNKLGHGYALISNHKPSINYLYFLSS